MPRNRSVRKIHRRTAAESGTTSGSGRFRQSADALDGPAYQTEVSGRREHVPVIGPHIAFSDFVCRRKMNCVSRTYVEISGSGNHQQTGPPQQSLVNGNEVPQPVHYVLGKARGQVARGTGRQCAFTHVAM